MINARGAIKGHQWIKQHCKAVIGELTTVSSQTTVIGFVMDSALANRKAFQEMHECEDHKMLLATEREPSAGSQSECIEDQTLGPLILLQCASHHCCTITPNLRKT
jgi:hypothetical protein